MRTVSIAIPDNIEIEASDLRILLATSLYEKGRLSSGQAALLAGLSKRAFIELLGQYGVSLFNYDRKELEEDRRNA